MGIAEVIERTLERVGAAGVHAFDSLYEADARGPRGRRRARDGARVSWLLAFLGFALLIVLHELGPLRRGQGRRHARRALRAVLPAAARCARSAGETEYAIGSIPLGGYVKISGMNPHEEIPPEVAHRALLPPARVEADRGHRRRAGGQHRARVPDPAGSCAGRSGVSEPTNRVEQIDDRSPAAGVLAPGDRIVAVDGVRGDPDALAKQIATHKCAGEQVDGCEAATPATLDRRARRRGADREAQARLRREPRRHARRLRGRRRDAAAGDRRRPTPRAARCRPDVVRHDARPSTRSPASSTPRSASRSPASSAPTRPRGRRSSSTPSGAIYLLALISLSLGIINLFPFLPLDGGHIFWAVAEKVRGQRDPVQRHGAGRLRRLRARDRAVRDRPHERHRPTDRARASASVAR